MSEEIVRELPIDQLFPHPDNVRGNIAPADVEEMALSILLRMSQGLPGVIQPLVAVAHNGNFRVVDGHVRLVGAMRLLETNRWPQSQPQTLPALVRDLTPEQQRDIMLSTNVVRYALNPVDEGLAYLRMVQEEGRNKSEVARRCGVSPARVESRLCIASLAPPVVEMYRRGELPLGAAPHLARITDSKVQVDLANTLVEMDAIHLDVIAEACRQVVEAGRECGSGGSGNGKAEAGDDGGDDERRCQAGAGSSTANGPSSPAGGGTACSSQPPASQSAAARRQQQTYEGDCRGS
jgi:ParB/RepB/Spo0J family partition protein